MKKIDGELYRKIDSKSQQAARTRISCVWYVLMVKDRGGICVRPYVL